MPLKTPPYRGLSRDVTAWAGCLGGYLGGQINNPYLAVIRLLQCAKAAELWTVSLPLCKLASDSELLFH